MINEAIANEAKAIVAVAFRNGPIENVHAGKPCPTCDGDIEYSHITQEEMKDIMKTAVSRVYIFLMMRDNNRRAYAANVMAGNLYTGDWDEPDLKEQEGFL
jgi:hypothetical protein